MKALTVFACESQPIVVEGLRRVLEADREFVLLGSKGTLAESLAMARDLSPDLVLLDHTAGFRSILEFIGELKSVSPGSQPVLWVSELAETESFRALQVGARGILQKTLPVECLLECLRAVAGGNIWMADSRAAGHARLPHADRKNGVRLTPREREIVKFVCKGMKNRQIAESLAITPGTVKVHLMHIFEKAGVRDRFELAVCGRRMLGAEPEQAG